MFGWQLLLKSVNFHRISYWQRVEDWRLDLKVKVFSKLRLGLSYLVNRCRCQSDRIASFKNEFLPLLTTKRRSARIWRWRKIGNLWRARAAEAAGRRSPCRDVHASPPPLAARLLGRLHGECAPLPRNDERIMVGGLYGDDVHQPTFCSSAIICLVLSAFRPEG